MFVNSSSDDEEVMIVAALLAEDESKKKRKRSTWIHPINRKRLNLGEFHHLFNDLKEDENKFFQYFRMSPTKFSELSDILEHELTFQNTSFRRAVSKEERLAVALRFFATGDTFRTIAFSYRLGETTVRNIVYGTCEAIWKKLGPLVIPSPSKETWIQNEHDFQRIWNFPNCITAIDGTHVVTDKPPNSGSLYFNYKKTFSIVLLAFVDAHCKFTAIDVGAYGRNSDGGIFANSAIGKKMFKNNLDLPQDKALPGTNVIMPHVFVGDEDFPLHKHLIRPYPGGEIRNNEEIKIYNYRLSRARRVSENAFGILTKRFRIYQRRLQIIPEHMDKIVLATCCLHNFLRYDTCHWTETDEDNQPSHGLTDMSGIGGTSTALAMEIRNTFKNYFSGTGSVSWQTASVRKGKRNTAVNIETDT